MSVRPKHGRAVNAVVSRFTVKRQELDAARVPALAELFGVQRLPLAESHVEVEIKGVSTAAVNALRRTLCDEMIGYALQVPGEQDFALTTEPFMLPQFVDQRISLLPLRQALAADLADSLELKLDVTNRGTSVMSVYAGDLEAEGRAPKEPLFNPTFRLAVLQPGRRLVIRGIRIASGFGRDNAAFMVARRVAHKHLDLPEFDRAAMHEPGGEAVDLSGYRDSSLVSDPRHHLLSAVIPATAPDETEVRAVFVEACNRVKERLRLVAATISAARNTQARDAGASFTVVRLRNGNDADGDPLELGTLQVPGETHTVGNLLRRTVYELTPNVSFVAYSIAANVMTLTLRHPGDVTAILTAAVQHAIVTFDAIQTGIANV